MGARILPRVYTQLASIVQARSSHVIIYGIHIYSSHTSTIDGARWIFDQVFMRPSYYSTDMSFIMTGSNILLGTDEVKTTQLFE
jgi:hypothetical protein